MSLNEFQLAQIKVLSKPYLQNWRKEFVRPGGMVKDIDIEIKGQSVVIFERQESFIPGNEDIIFPVAKTTYMKTENRWKILWQRHDLKWHAYEPDMFVDDFEGFLKVVDEDDCCAFWG